MWHVGIGNEWPSLGRKKNGFQIFGWGGEKKWVQIFVSIGAYSISALCLLS